MFRKILVPLDGSEAAAQALPFALTLLPPGKRTLCLLRAVALDTLFVVTPPAGGEVAPRWPDPSGQLAREKAMAYLKAVQAAQLADHPARR